MHNLYHGLRFKMAWILPRISAGTKRGNSFCQFLPPVAAQYATATPGKQETPKNSFYGEVLELSNNDQWKLLSFFKSMDILGVIFSKRWKINVIWKETRVFPFIFIFYFYTFILELILYEKTLTDLMFYRRKALRHRYTLPFTRYVLYSTACFE